MTVIDGMGWYSKQPKKVLMILAKRNESVKIFRLIKSIDPKAFISQSNVVGVYGEGFENKSINLPFGTSFFPYYKGEMFVDDIGDR